MSVAIAQFSEFEILNKSVPLKSFPKAKTGIMGALKKSSSELDAKQIEVRRYQLQEWLKGD